MHLYKAMPHRELPKSVPTDRLVALYRVSPRGMLGSWYEWEDTRTGERGKMNAKHLKHFKLIAIS